MAKPGRIPTLVCLVLVLVACSGTAPVSPTMTPTAAVVEVRPTAPAPSPTAPAATPNAPTPTPLPVAVGLAPAIEPSPTVSPTQAAGAPFGAESASVVAMASEPAQPIEYVVQPGEALLTLAKRYQVPVAAIQLENDLGEKTTVQAGQVLLIPPADQWSEASPYWMVHEVKAGDTLIAIAASFDVDLEALIDLNQLGDGALLSIGQELILPLEGLAEMMAKEAAVMGPLRQSTAPSASSDGGSAPSPVPLPPPAAPPADVAGWPYHLFTLINQVRAAHGLYPLAYNETLAWAAQLHAQDCQARGWCSHVGSDGSSSADRIRRVGYPAAGTAECWVQAATPQAALDFWYNETPPYDAHRRTLLTSYLSEVGIGIAATGWGYYIVADFGRP